VGHKNGTSNSDEARNKRVITLAARKKAKREKRKKKARQ
jgi:hypothetical protein